MFFLTSFSLYAKAQDTSDPLNKFILNQSPPLACSTQNYQWDQKSAPDAITTPMVESQTLFLQADNITGQNKQTHVATGNVLGYKDNQTIAADWLIYDQAQDRVTGGDHVVVTRQYDAITGSWGDYYLDLDHGTFKQARAYYRKENLSATGKQINVLDSQHLNIENGYITACDPNDPAWYIKSSQMNFDYQDSQGSARNAVMFFESAPIFASPYLTFPLGQRRSGWLTPNFGGTSTSGFMLNAPYYWNMAPNYDMTITPYYWANQGFMLSDQFRYMSKNNTGSIYTEQLPQSTGTNQYRYYWSLTDTYNPLKYLTMGYNYNQVSDPNYFNDFGNFYSVTDNVNLDHSLFINYAPTWGNAGIRVQDYQTLYPFGTTQTIPIYSQYPAINFNVYPQTLGGGFKGALTSNYSNYYNSQMQSGDRLVLYPSITYPMQTSWGSLTPKIGNNFTSYDLANNPGYPNSAQSIQRNIPIASLDGNLYFDRPLSMAGGNYTQTFEPRAYYLYIPEVNQSNLPVFDTSTATYNYSQLFNENRFSGFDRINMANDITLGATSRLLNDTTGAELMNFSLGYRYFITPENVFLYGNKNQYSQLFLPAPNLIAELSNNWSRTLSSSASFQYDTTYSNVDAYNVNLKWSPEDGKTLSIGYSYQYQLPLLFYAYTPGQQFAPTMFENQYAFNIAGQWPIYQNKIFAIGRANYDATLQQWLNLVGGLEYNGGCYSISLVYQQFLINYNQSQQNYLFNISFRGIGSFGSDPGNVLKPNVPGYMPISQMQQNQFTQ